MNRIMDGWAPEGWQCTLLVCCVPLERWKNGLAPCEGCPYAVRETDFGGVDLYGLGYGREGDYYGMD